MNTDEHGFNSTRRLSETNPFLAGEIINYEYGKKMDGGKIAKDRISAVAAATDDEMIKGVCHSMLEEDKEALKIFRAEGEKRFSLLEGCMRWPVLSRHLKALTEMLDELLKAKRSLADLPTA